MARPKIEISFEYDAEEKITSAESWYLSACELIFVQRQLEKQIFSILKNPKDIDPIFLTQKYVDIALRPLDAVGGLSRVYMYTSGVVFENLTKCIIVHNAPELISEIMGQKGHNLPYLLRSCDFELSEEETTSFSRLSAYVVWAGKYACPKIKKNDRNTGTVSFVTEDVDFINSWVSRLNEVANEVVYKEKIGRKGSAIGTTGQ